MARPGSIAVAGYYPAPLPVVERITAIFAPKGEDEVDVTFVDPCAGDGAAVLKLVELLCGGARGDRIKLYTCELESTRHAALVSNVGRLNYEWSKNALEGDAFRVTFAHTKHSGAGILYLNPPYDTDPVHGRLEQRFLERFTGVLATGGELVFVVPYYALEASADLLGREYEDLRCFRFPAPDFDAYKQVVLVAKKSAPLFLANPETVALVNEWVTNPDSIPELPQVGDSPLLPLPVAPPWEGGLDSDSWQIRPVDVVALIGKVKPWTQSTRGGALLPVPGIVPDLPVQDLLLRKYPMATPPRPAHIAAGIASGLFNGARIEADSARLPPLLVKGVFDKEYRTVEEKTNADGEIRGLVQVQQPKLITTVLDLRTHKYHQLKTGTEETSSFDVAEMTVADLLKHYGASLMHVMETQCPILYDPRRDADSIPLAASPRKLFTAQAHASRALVKLLGGPKASYRDRRGTAAILLGEIGSGKSSVSVMAAKTIRARRLLIMCPPHLLRSWENELAVLWPEADVRVLQKTSDVESVAASTPDRPIVAILSREVAKLSHAWEGTGAVCPRCGHYTPEGDLAKTRARCEAQELIPLDELAREAMGYAQWLANHAPQSPGLRDLIRGRFGQIRLEKLAAKQAQAKTEGRPWAFPGTPPALLDRALELLIKQYEGAANQEDIQRAITLCLLATADNERIIATARRFAAASAGDYRASEFVRTLLLLLPPGSAQQQAIAEELQKSSTASYGYNPWASFSAAVEQVKGGTDFARVGALKISWKDDVLSVDGKTLRSAGAAAAALGAIRKCARFSWGEPCGEFLFQAIATPRRVALARHIVSRYPSLFDFLILDEGHEYATEGSAQEKSAHRLTSLGIPTVFMTGTIMNGYADSLFTNMWALSADFRKEFGRDDKQRFIDRYGYRKRLLEDRDEKGAVVVFGSNSDRETHSERIIGNAPGLLPLFLLRHLLPIAVTLHKADLAIDLPPSKLELHLIAPDAEVKSRYLRLQAALVKQIKKDLFGPLAGKLWGQLAEIPSYLDRATADVGNNETGSYAIQYPEAVGGELVAVEEGLEPSTILPKEAWMLALVEKELAEGRRVMVFPWHVALMPRLAKLISERINEPVPILVAEKVGTAKRQDWIDREVVKKGRRVLVTNPVAIQTGLNNLVHFATEIWMENPACNPVIYRQAIGRVDRIGQKLDTRIHFPVYDGTLQVQLYDLLAKKVAVSVSTDGLDPESALQAAGVGEDEYLAGLSIGKQLWAMLNGDGEKLKPQLQVVPKSTPAVVVSKAVVPRETEAEKAAVMNQAATPPAEAAVTEDEDEKTPRGPSRDRKAMEVLEAGGYFRKQLERGFHGGEKFKTRLRDANGHVVPGVGEATKAAFERKGLLFKKTLPSSSVYPEEWRLATKEERAVAEASTAALRQAREDFQLKEAAHPFVLLGHKLDMEYARRGDAIYDRKVGDKEWLYTAAAVAWPAMRERLGSFFVEAPPSEQQEQVREAAKEAAMASIEQPAYEPFAAKASDAAPKEAPMVLPHGSFVSNHSTYRVFLEGPEGREVKKLVSAGNTEAAIALARLGNPDLAAARVIRVDLKTDRGDWMPVGIPVPASYREETATPEIFGHDSAWEYGQAGEAFFRRSAQRTYASPAEGWEPLERVVGAAGWASYTRHRHGPTTRLGVFIAGPVGPSVVVRPPMPPAAPRVSGEIPLVDVVQPGSHVPGLEKPNAFLRRAAGSAGGGWIRIAALATFEGKPTVWKSSLSNRIQIARGLGDGPGWWVTMLDEYGQPYRSDRARDQATAFRLAQEQGAVFPDIDTNNQRLIKAIDEVKWTLSVGRPIEAALAEVRRVMAGGPELVVEPEPLDVAEVPLTPPAEIVRFDAPKAPAVETPVVVPAQDEGRSYWLDRNPHPPCDPAAYVDYDALQKAIDDQARRRRSGMDAPLEIALPPLGTWARESFKGNHGHEIAVLVELDPNTVRGVESPLTEGRRAYVEQYAEWLKEGHQPPPIRASETSKGTLQISDGHRRLEAARMAGKPIVAWLWPTGPHPEGLVEAYHSKPMRVGLTLEMVQKMFCAAPEHAHVDPLPVPESLPEVPVMSDLQTLKYNVTISGALAIVYSTSVDGAIAEARGVLRDQAGAVDRIVRVLPDGKRETVDLSAPKPAALAVVEELVPTRLRPYDVSDYFVKVGGGGRAWWCPECKRPLANGYSCPDCARRGLYRLAEAVPEEMNRQILNAIADRTRSEDAPAKPAALETHRGGMHMGEPPGGWRPEDAVPLDRQSFRMPAPQTPRPVGAQKRHMARPDQRVVGDTMLTLCGRLVSRMGPGLVDKAEDVTCSGCRAKLAAMVAPPPVAAAVEAVEQQIEEKLDRDTAEHDREKMKMALALMSTGGKPSAWFAADGRLLLEIKPDPEKPGQWLVTKFEEGRGPTGYTTAADEREAFKIAKDLGARFPEVEPGAGKCRCWSGGACDIAHAPESCGCRQCTAATKNATAKELAKWGRTSTTECPLCREPVGDVVSHLLVDHEHEVRQRRANPDDSLIKLYPALAMRLALRPDETEVDSKRERVAAFLAKIVESAGYRVLRTTWGHEVQGKHGGVGFPVLDIVTTEPADRHKIDAALEGRVERIPLNAIPWSDDTMRFRFAYNEDGSGRTQMAEIDRIMNNERALGILRAEREAAERAAPPRAEFEILGHDRTKEYARRGDSIYYRARGSTGGPDQGWRFESAAHSWDRWLAQHQADNERAFRELGELTGPFVKEGDPEPMPRAPIAKYEVTVGDRRWSTVADDPYEAVFRARLMTGQELGAVRQIVLHNADGTTSAVENKWHAPVTRIEETSRDARHVSYWVTTGGQEFRVNAANPAAALEAIRAKFPRISRDTTAVFSYADGVLKRHPEYEVAAHVAEAARDEGLAVADVILSQMGGMNRLRAMLGAKDFVGDEKSLTFKWSSKDKVRGNCVRITLTPADVYDMEFFYVKSPEFKSTKLIEGLYAEDLVRAFESFTGLDAHIQ